MPLSNVFRNTFQNPFHGSRKGGRHGRAESLGSLTNSNSSLPGTPGIVVVPLVDHKRQLHASSMPSSSPMVSRKVKNDKKIKTGVSNSNKENRDTTISKPSLNKGKQRKDSKESKKSKDSKSSSSTLSACQLEQLQPTPMDLNLSHLHTRLAPSTEDTLAQLKVGRRHSSHHRHQDLTLLSTLSTPTPDSLLLSPASMDAPSTPSSPLTPALFSSSPLCEEPLSMFAEGYEHEEQISELPDLGSLPKQEPKRKRLSTGSIHLGQLLANTFKPKHRRSASVNGHTVHPVVSTVKTTDLVPDAEVDIAPAETPATTKPPEHRKRRSLFAKLPKLDTRQTPKIVISAPIKGRLKVPKFTRDRTDPQESCDEQQTSDESGSGSGSPPVVFTPALLSPFYLPSPSLPRTCTQDGADSNRLLALPNGVALKDHLEHDEKAAPPNLKGPQWDLDWRRNSRVYYDDRWDRASVMSVDSEMIRLAEDPDFPGYPERNAYWEQHCQIRERRWKQQLQQYAQDKDGPTGRWMKNKSKTGATTSFSEDSTSILEKEEDGGAQELEDSTQGNKRFHHVTMLLHTAANPAEAARAAAQQAQNRPPRTRYSSYSAYMAAMKLKSRNRTDRMRYSVDAIATNPPRDDLPKISPRLIDDVRALKERSLQQKAEQRSNYVKTITDRFEGMPDSDNETSLVRNGVPLLPSAAQKIQPQFLSPLDAFDRGSRGMGTNAGSSDEDDDELSYRTPAQRIRTDYQISQGFSSPQRQQQPDSGILFVASTTTTAEVFPGLTHDPQASLSNPKIGYIQSAVHNTGSTQDGGGIGNDKGGQDREGKDVAVGGLVPSYFDKRRTAPSTSESIRDRDGYKKGRCVSSGGGGVKVGSSGFMMLQSSFGDQGFNKRLNPSAPLSSCRVTRASAAPLHPQRS